MKFRKPNGELSAKHWEMGSQDENNAKEKIQGTKLVFSPKVVLVRVSSPVLDLHYPCLDCCSYSSSNESFVTIKILQIF
jgi:hypothetical protein